MPYFLFLFVLQHKVSDKIYVVRDAREVKNILCFLTVYYCYKKQPAQKVIKYRFKQKLVSCRRRNEESCNANQFYRYSIIFV